MHMTHRVKLRVLMVVIGHPSSVLGMVALSYVVTDASVQSWDCLVHQGSSALHKLPEAGQEVTCSPYLMPDKNVKRIKMFRRH